MLPDSGGKLISVTELRWAFPTPTAVRMHKPSGPCLNIKAIFPKYGDSRVKDKTVVRPSYLWHGDPYTGKTTSLYWDAPWIQWYVFPYHKGQFVLLYFYAKHTVNKTFSLINQNLYLVWNNDSVWILESLRCTYTDQYWSLHSIHHTPFEEL